MSKILFVRKPHVYLPELPAYKQYLAKHHPKVTTIESTYLESYNPKEYDIIWHFMGLDTNGAGNYVVHEYNSLSTQPFAKLKNIIKNTINKKPDRRVFLSEKVRADFGFKDDVPSHIRNMGIDEQFFGTKHAESPEYNFIYVGGLNRGPIIEKVLDNFKTNLKGATVLLVGDAPSELKQRYKDCKNIIFHGRVAYENVPALLGKARYGLNIMPDTYPFNVQTATKVIEYCAAGLPVVTTDYEWIRTFEKETGAACFKIDGQGSNMTMDALAAFEFNSPSCGNLKWEQVIAESGIFGFLG